MIELMLQKFTNFSKSFPYAPKCCILIDASGKECEYSLDWVISQLEKGLLCLRNMHYAKIWGIDMLIPEPSWAVDENWQSVKQFYASNAAQWLHKLCPHATENTLTVMSRFAKYANITGYSACREPDGAKRIRKYAPYITQLLTFATQALDGKHTRLSGDDSAYWDWVGGESNIKFATKYYGFSFIAGQQHLGIWTESAFFSRGDWEKEVCENRVDGYKARELLALYDVDVTSLNKQGKFNVFISRDGNAWFSAGSDHDPWVFSKSKRRHLTEKNYAELEVLLKDYLEKAMAKVVGNEYYGCPDLWSPCHYMYIDV